MICLPSTSLLALHQAPCSWPLRITSTGPPSPRVSTQWEAQADQREGREQSQGIYFLASLLVGLLGADFLTCTKGCGCFQEALPSLALSGFSSAPAPCSFGPRASWLPDVANSGLWAFLLVPQSLPMPLHTQLLFDTLLKLSILWVPDFLWDLTGIIIGIRSGVKTGFQNWVAQCTWGRHG